MNIKTNSKGRRTKKTNRIDILWRVRAVGLCGAALVLSLYPFREAFEAKASTKEVELAVPPIVEPICTTEAETNETPVSFAEEIAVSETTEVVVEEETVVVDEYDKELLALVIYQEAGADYCSDDTRRMVGEVVLNRVADSRYPDTIEEVLLQKQQYGRLYWTGICWSERASEPTEANAVARAYRIAEELLTSDERLLPDDVIFQSEYVQGTEIVAESDGIYFCR